MNRFTKTILTLLVMFIIPVASIMAYDYGAPISDRADIFSSAEEISLLDQINQFEMELETEVHIITVPNMGGKSRDNFALHLKDTTSEFRADDGKWVENVIILLIAMDERETGIYYGDRWKKTLDKNWNRIYEDSMKSNFGAGKFERGFRSAMKEIYRLVDLELNPVVKDPVNLTGLWILLGALAGIGLMVALIMLINKTIKKFVRNKLALENARSRVHKLQARFYETALASKNLRVKIKAQLEEVSKLVHRDDLFEFLQIFDRDTTGIVALINSFVALEKENLGGDEKDVTTETYRFVATEMSSMLENIDEIKESSKSIQKNLVKTSQIAKKIPMILDNAEGTLSDSKNMVQMIDDLGYNVPESRKLLILANEAIQKAKDGIKSKHLRTAARDAESASKFGKQAADKAEYLPKWHEELEERIPKTEATLEKCKGEIEVARKVYLKLVDMYSADCLESIAGNGSGSEKRVIAIEEAISAAKNAIKMSEQNWSLAQEAVDASDKWNVEIRELMEDIHTIKRQLEKAKAASPKEIQDAQDDIDKAWVFIKNHDPETTENLKSDLEKLQSRLNQVKEEYSQTKPNYFMIVKVARAVNNSADKVLDEARDQYEKMERLKRKIPVEIREGVTEIQRAKSYISRNNYDVEYSAKSKLKSAQNALVQAENLERVFNSRRPNEEIDARDLHDIIRYADEAEEFAKKALRMAKSDVDDAERARRRARQAAESAARAARMASSSSSSSSSFGGGGFSGGGGSFGGGGGLSGGGGSW